MYRRYHQRVYVWKNQFCSVTAHHTTWPFRLHYIPNLIVTHSLFSPLTTKTSYPSLPSLAVFIPVYFIVYLTISQSAYICIYFFLSIGYLSISCSPSSSYSFPFPSFSLSTVCAVRHHISIHYTNTKHPKCVCVCVCAHRCMYRRYHQSVYVWKNQFCSVTAHHTTTHSSNFRFQF
jgi:hypothetical protein